MPRRNAPAADLRGLNPETLFRELAAQRGLVVAVSGGPDSTALAVLLAAWRARPPLIVVAVDHGLRPEAAGEARLAADNAARLGLPSRIMRADERPSGNLQDWARRTRYRLLAAAAAEAGFDTIVTAHHQDDQAETFLLRLARGSGVYGLGAMAREGEIAGLRLVRPLLGVPRAVLAGIAEASGLPVASDRSNSDRRFDRVRLREIMPALDCHGLDAPRLAGTAGRLKRAADALDHYARGLLRDNFAADPYGAVQGPATAFKDVPEEVGLRALALLVTAAGGAGYTPRLDRLEALHTAVLSAPESRFKRTLHGATLSVADGRLTVCREWGRSGPAAAAAPGGAMLLWDRRFHIRVPPAAESLQIGPLGRSARRLRFAPAGQGAIRTLPGLFAGDTLLAVPDPVIPADDGAPLGRLAAECIVGSRIGLGPALRSP